MASDAKGGPASGAGGGPAPAEPDAPRRSPFACLGCGCGGLMLALLTGATVFSLVGYREAQKLEAGSVTPEERRERALEVLGAEEIPEGFVALGGVRIPFMFSLAILGDAPAEAFPDELPTSRRFRERGFVWAEMLSLTRDEEAMRSYFLGAGDGEVPEAESSLPVPEGDPGDNVEFQVDFEPREVVARGRLESPPGGAEEILWLARRGELTLAEGPRPGVATVFHVDCPRSRRFRLGLLFGPDPAPEAAAAEIDWTGTPADPARLRELVESFAVCG